MVHLKIDKNNFINVNKCRKWYFTLGPRRPMLNNNIHKWIFTFGRFIFRSNRCWIWLTKIIHFTKRKSFNVWHYEIVSPVCEIDKNMIKKNLLLLIREKYYFTFVQVLYIKGWARIVALFALFLFFVNATLNTQILINETRKAFNYKRHFML